MTLINVLSVLSGSTMLIAYFFYIKQSVKGESTPNPASWAIWLLAGIINAFTYFSVVEDNVWQSFFVGAEAISVLAVFLYALLKGKFSKISTLEVLVFILCLSIGTFWQLSSNDRIANLLLQGIYVISYVPTIVGLYKGKAKEHYLSWTLAVLAYTFATLSLVISVPSDWIAFVHPILNGILGNGLIVYLILERHQKLTA